jgi:hypothetical protein
MSHPELPPDIKGEWYYFAKVLRLDTPTSIPTFNYVTSQFISSIQQDNQFIIITIPADPPLRENAGYYVGYWNKVYTATGFFWQLSFPDYDDNGVFVVTVSEVDSEGRAIKLAGNYNEAGFEPPSNLQKPTVGGVTLTKITYN